MTLGSSRNKQSTRAVKRICGKRSRGRRFFEETADERPCKTLEKRVIIEDLHASIFRAVGISPRLSYETEKRPFYVTRDGLGKPILELFA